MEGREGYRLRPFTVADGAAVVALLNAEGAASLALRRAALDGVGAVRLLRYVAPASPRVVALSGDGTPVGFAYVADRDQGIVLEMGGAVHPDHWGRGVGRALVAWGESRAAELARAAPAGVKVLLQCPLYEGEARARRLLARAGFAPVREWLHLALDLDRAPAAPTIPPGLRLAPMELDADWERVGPAMEAAYADHWGTLPSLDEAAEERAEAGDESPEDDSYSNAPGFCFLLLSGDEVAGGILCNAKVVERDDTGRVGSLFVRPEYRRAGAGRALMLAAFGAFWRAGLRRVILDTDAASFTGAPRFYGALGMRPYRREFLYEKTIRPGRELRRLTR